MKYEDAVALWGANKLRKKYNLDESSMFSEVKISVDLDMGCECCTGPSSDVVVSGYLDGERHRGVFEHRIDCEDFDLYEVVRQIVQEGNGVLTAE